VPGPNGALYGTYIFVHCAAIYITSAAPTSRSASTEARGVERLNPSVPFQVAEKAFILEFFQQWG
jgi:hypothetical protein